MDQDIYQAINANDLQAVSACLASGRDFEREGGWLPLHAASGHGNLDIVKAILAHMDASPHASTDYINTSFETGDDCEYRGSALTEALLNGHKEVARFLVEQGADVNASYYSERRNTPEWFLGQFDLVTHGGVAWWLADDELFSLMSTEIKIDAVDNEDKTLLAHAVENSKDADVLRILREGASLDLPYYSEITGCTLPPLFQSAIIHAKKTLAESLKIVELLLKYGAPLDTAFEGESVIDVVLDQANPDLIRLFGLNSVLQMKQAENET